MMTAFFWGSLSYSNGYMQTSETNGIVDFSKWSDRPFRTGYFKFDPVFDQAKPLGVADFSGWIHTEGLIIGSIGKSWVVAFDANYRNLVWKVKIESDITSPIASVGRWVIAGARDGSLIKIESKTGKIVWRANIDSFVARELTINGPNVFVISASQHLYNIDLQTGKIKWLYDGGFPEGLVVRSLAAPVVHEKSVYYGISTGEIVSVNEDTGALNWKFNPEFSDSKFLDIVGEMVVINNRLLFSRYDGIVGAVSIQGAPKLVWSYKSAGISNSAFRSGRLFVGGINGEVASLDAITGKQIWKRNTGETVATLTIGEKLIYLGGSSGRITVMDSTDGQLKWVDHLEGRLAGPPFYIGNSIYFSTGAKNVYGYKVL